MPPLRQLLNVGLQRSGGRTSTAHFVTVCWLNGKRTFVGTVSTCGSVLVKSLYFWEKHRWQKHTLSKEWQKQWKQLFSLFSRDKHYNVKKVGSSYVDMSRTALQKTCSNMEWNIRADDSAGRKILSKWGGDFISKMRTIYNACITLWSLSTCTPAQWAISHLKFREK